ncbi:helix-turn-helix domain-containing protein [Collimonas fungivorans]|uniref:helix-turn-helix domain-containing protein n=1 Tax=Collimonas fungivorans TaxID=158899 RepID=UPI0009EF58A2|nr:helix-turn-helix transcriptional regulator [Collimonas fungivorans]
MTKTDPQARAFRAALVFKSKSITQADVASAIHASQSQVSRILNGRGLRQSRVFEELCIYAENMAKKTSVDSTRANQELVEALAETWDGTAAHSKALAAVIRSLALLAPTESKT